MSTTPQPNHKSQFYSSTRFLDSEKELLNSKFLDFVDILKIGFAFAKRNLSKCWLRILVWHIVWALCSFFVVTLLIFVVVIVSSVIPSDVSQLFFEYSEYVSEHILALNINSKFENLDEDILLLVNFTVLFIFAYLFYFLVDWLMRTFLSLRLYFRLNSTQDQGLFANFTLSSKKLLKLIGLQLLNLLIRLPLISIGLAIFWFTFTFFRDLQVQDFSQTGIADMSQLGAYSVFGVILILIASISLARAVVALLSSIVKGFLGLSPHLIIQENKGILESMTDSYQASKAFFWQNTLRWFLFYLSLGAVNSFVSNTFFLLLILISSVFPPATLLYILFLYLHIFMVWVANTCFSYLSFYNFRMLYDSKDS